MPVNLELDTATRDVLDFSKLIINSQEELDEALQKVPDYRTRPEKIRLDDLHIDYSNFSFSVTKAELLPENYEFLCPIPAPLNQVKLDDIKSMDINWVMLTPLRAETKQDEEIFNRIVQLERVTYKTVIKEQALLIKAQFRARNKKIKSKIGSKSHTDDRSDICPECDDEHCSGICKEFLYEAHERLPPADDDDAQTPQPLSAGKDGEKKKKKIKKKIKKKVESLKEDVTTLPKENKVIKKRKTLDREEKIEGAKVKTRNKSKVRKSKTTPDLGTGDDNKDVKSLQLKTQVKNKLPTKAITNSKLTTKNSAITAKIISPRQTKKKTPKTDGLTESKEK